MADTTQPARFNWSVLEHLKSPWTVTALIFVAIAVLDPGNLTGAAQKTADGYFGTLPFILLAVGMVAYLKASGAEALVAKAFQGRETRMIFLAALFGGLAPFCS